MNMVFKLMKKVLVGVCGCIWSALLQLHPRYCDCHFKIVWALVFLLVIFIFPHSAIAQSCGHTGPGPAFTNAIGQIEGNALKSLVAAHNNSDESQSIQAWEGAKQQAGALCPCNALQSQYQKLTLEYLGWQQAAESCYWGIYVDLGTPGGPSVGDWLNCIHPVNLGIVAAANARSAIHFEVSQEPCNANYDPAGQDAIIFAEVYNKTRDLADS